MRAVGNLNAKKMVKLLPKDLIEAIEDQEYFDSDNYADYLEDVYEELDDELKDEYGDNYRRSFRILSVQKIDGKEFRDLVDELEESYDMDGDRITAAKRVSVLTKIKGSEDSFYGAGQVFVIKYKGKWYPIS